MVHRALALYGTLFLARGEGKVYVLDHCSFCVLFVTYFKLLGVLLRGLIRTPLPLNSPWDCLMFNLLSSISWLRFVMRNQINCQAVDECPAWLSSGSHKRSNQPNSKSETMIRQRRTQRSIHKTTFRLARSVFLRWRRRWIYYWLLFGRKVQVQRTSLNRSGPKVVWNALRDCRSQNNTGVTWQIDIFSRS